VKVDGDRGVVEVTKKPLSYVRGSVSGVGG
jgi:hypothetical protein